MFMNMVNVFFAPAFAYIYAPIMPSLVTVFKYKIQLRPRPYLTPVMKSQQCDQSGSFPPALNSSLGTPFNNKRLCSLICRIILNTEFMFHSLLFQ